VVPCDILRWDFLQERLAFKDTSVDDYAANMMTAMLYFDMSYVDQVLGDSTLNRNDCWTEALAGSTFYLAIDESVDDYCSLHDCSSTDIHRRSMYELDCKLRGQGVNDLLQTMLYMILSCLAKYKCYSIDYDYKLYIRGGAKCLQIASLVLIALTIRFNCH